MHATYKYFHIPYFGWKPNYHQYFGAIDIIICVLCTRKLKLRKKKKTKPTNLLNQKGEKQSRVF